MKQTIFIIALSILNASCGFYSFTGASIPNEANTISVNYFTTTTTNTPSLLKEKMTEGLKDLFISETNLDLIENEGDLIFDGEITKYEVKPITIQSNESVEKNRLTISVKVNYKNSFDDNKSFNNTFSHYRDFDSSENLSEIEEILIEEITQKLIEDIFNKAFVNW